MWEQLSPPDSTGSCANAGAASGGLSYISDCLVSPKVRHRCGVSCRAKKEQLKRFLRCKPRPESSLDKTYMCHIFSTAALSDLSQESWVGAPPGPRLTRPANTGKLEQLCAGSVIMNGKSQARALLKTEWTFSQLEVRAPVVRRHNSA